MNVIEKNKLKVILVITSILALVFIAIVGVEYLDKKREDRAIKYYEEIYLYVITICSSIYELQQMDRD